MEDNASEKIGKNEKIEEKGNNEISTLSLLESSEKAKKTRKPFEWTEKRLEAFKKMREGLETKNVIAKELKAEKKKSEKDEIKKRIRDLMNNSASSKKVASASSDESSESESDHKVVSKAAKNSRRKEKDEKAAKPKAKRARTPPPSEASSEEESEPSSSEEEERVLMSKKQHQKLVQNKQSNGKTPRNAKVFNAMDNFILL